jgi:hypothetical protein
MEELYLLKLQELKGIKNNDGGGEFKYDTFDIW